MEKACLSFDKASEVRPTLPLSTLPYPYPTQTGWPESFLGIGVKPVTPIQSEIKIDFSFSPLKQHDREGWPCSCSRGESSSNLAHALTTSLPQICPTICAIPATELASTQDASEPASLNVN